MSGGMVVIGTNDLDEYYEMDTVPVMGDKVICRFMENRVGGMLGNAAAVYAGYGCKTYMIDFVNGGALSHILEQDLKNYGVDTSCFTIDKTLPDPKCLIMLKDGERVIFVISKGKKELALSQEQKTLITHADVVYSTLSELGTFAKSERIMQQIWDSDAKLALDLEAGTLTNPDEDFDSMLKSDILFINSGSNDKMQTLYGEHYIQRLQEAGCILVLTKGSAGCSVYSKEENPVHISGHPIKAVDTTGAGDTFNASFLYGLFRGWTLKACAEFANAAAARAIGFMGARSGVAKETEVNQFYKKILNGGNIG